MNAAICPICKQPIDPGRYRVAAHKLWDTIAVCYPAPCWDNREQLRAPGVQVVGKPDPAQVPLVQFYA